MVGLAMWIGSDAIGVEEQMAPLLGEGYDAETWKVDDWYAKDRPEIIVYEDTTARSDTYHIPGQPRYSYNGLWWPC